jgi:archaellum biogenesis ATPase FlaH
MELFTAKSLDQTEAYDFFTTMKANKVPSDLAIAKALREEIGAKDELLDGQLNIIRKMVYYGYTPSSYMSPEVQEIYEEKRLTQDYFSCFNFLLKHYGLRKGCLHLLVGDTGKGKSTLIRSIALESSIKKNVFILLSEENTDAYSHKLNETASIFKNSFSFYSMNLNNIKLATELMQDFQPERDFKRFFDMISDFIIRDKIDLFIYDNFSTGLFGDKYELQKDAVKKFKELSLKFKIPFIIVSHPKKGAFYESLFLTPDLIRGNSSLSTMPEFIYTLNSCELDGKLKNYLLIAKSRDYDKARGLWFELRYTQDESKNGYYSGDSKISGDIVVENLKKARKSIAK